jgi:glycosyltransferase involved in cell wall biosynthesis
MAYKKEGWSILIPVYNAAEWIEECLDSVENQTYFKNNDDYEIILGIDACESTLKKVEEIKDKYKNLRIYWLEENVGCYVTLNTILSKVMYDKTITIGSDDKFFPSAIEKIAPHMLENDVVYYHIQNSYEDGRQEVSAKYCEGVAAIKYSVWDKILGAYWKYRTSGDSDVEIRLQKAGVKTHIINKPLYWRRIHSKSLTQSAETGYNSEYRKKLNHKLGDKIYRHPIKSNNYKVII